MTYSNMDEDKRLVSKEMGDEFVELIKQYLVMSSRKPVSDEYGLTEGFYTKTMGNLVNMALPSELGINEEEIAVGLEDTLKEINETLK